MDDSNPTEKPSTRSCSVVAYVCPPTRAVNGQEPKSALGAGDFNGRWPSRTFVQMVATLSSTCFELSVTAQNTGRDPLPLGIGWHPYFAIPSGDRTQARLHIPAGRRASVTCG
ncbi:MAG TPA: hypothetical protein VFP91_13880 [Vicinamibacterales bacterium]|nr:hypothetical protein [Vicinamibacterales bacterium]